MKATLLNLSVRIFFLKERPYHKVYESTYSGRKVFAGWPEQPESALMINILIQYG